MIIFLKSLSFNMLFSILLLTIYFLIHYDITNISALSYISKNIEYERLIDSPLILRPNHFGSVIYNIQYVNIEMEKKGKISNTSHSEITTDPRDNAIISMQKYGTANGLLPEYSLTIHGNGSVVYKGIKNVDTIGMKSYQISPDKSRELVNGFINIYYNALKEKYGNSSNSSNIPIVITSINLNGRIKTVIDYHNSYAPPSLRELEDKIDQLANSKQWIKLR